jgi:hypothetical protein
MRNSEHYDSYVVVSPLISISTYTLSPGECKLFDAK